MYQSYLHTCRVTFYIDSLSCSTMRELSWAERNNTEAHKRHWSIARLDSLNPRGNAVQFDAIIEALFIVALLRNIPQTPADNCVTQLAFEK